MLTEKLIRQTQPAEKIVKLKDGLGLAVEIRPTGARVFTKEYRFAGKRRKDTLGEYPTVSLLEARTRTLEINQKVKDGVDPRQPCAAGAAKVSRQGAAPSEDHVPVERRFETVADMFINKREQEGVAQATLNKLNWNLGFAKGNFEGRDVGSIKPPEILGLVERVQATGKLEKAKDIHRKLGQVFDYAIGLGLVEWNPAHMVKRAVVKTKGGRHPGITAPEQVGELVRAIRGYSGQATTRTALMLAALTALRSTELRGARWSEIDFDAALWTVPAERMKGHYGEHLVPLSQQALTILEGLNEWTGGCEFLFPAHGYKDGRHMSNATINAALRRLGYDTRKDHCLHGFRTTFSTSLNERGWNRDWIERQLCHVDDDEVRSAYNKALYLEGRTEMMQAYADWLDEVARSV